jgi:competence protein ComEC
MTKYIIFIFSFMLFPLVLWSINRQKLQISFCDVGQGDATLLSIGTTQMLIDAGRNAKVLRCLENHMPLWDKQIEFLVLTHMDADHIGGAPQVLDFYDVSFVFMNPSNKKTSDFNLLEQAISRKKASKTKVIDTFLGQKFRISDGFHAVVVSPAIDFSQVQQVQTSSAETILSDTFLGNSAKKPVKIDENNLSIALFITFGEVKMLLPGDLESAGELAIIKSGLLDRVAILKAGHHGSKTSSTPGFIEVLQPEINIISSGKNNAYNHPHPQVIDIFKSFKSLTFQTKNSGELNFASDGHSFWQTTR